MSCRSRRYPLVILILLLAFAPAQAARITDKLLAGFYSKPDTSSQPIKVLPSDTPLERLERSGDLTRVRLGDGSEGWVESRFITDEKPARIMLLELQVKNSELQQQLREAEKQLSQGATNGKAGSDPAIADLKRQLADIQAERDALKQALAEAASAAPATSDAEPENAALQARIAELEQSLSAAQKESKPTPPLADETAELAGLRQRLAQIAVLAGDPAAAPPVEPESPGFTAWHLPLLGLALLLSFIGGIAFKNHRLAKRYGGFRL